MTLEENISKCIDEKGFSLTVVSRKTGIPYRSLYNSLMNKNSDRELRGKELVSVCAFLGINPMDFMDREVV